MKTIYIFPLILLLIGCGAKETKVQGSNASVEESMKVILTSAQMENAGVKIGSME